MENLWELKEKGLGLQKILHTDNMLTRAGKTKKWKK